MKLFVVNQVRSPDTVKIASKRLFSIIKYVQEDILLSVAAEYLNLL